MPRPLEAKPTAHLDAGLKKSDYGRLLTHANAYGVSNALSIRGDVSNNLNPLNHTADPIRLSLEEEGKRVSDCFVEGIKS